MSLKSSSISSGFNADIFDENVDGDIFGWVWVVMSEGGGRGLPRVTLRSRCWSPAQAAALAVLTLPPRRLRR